MTVKQRFSVAMMCFVGLALLVLPVRMIATGDYRLWAAELALLCVFARTPVTAGRSWDGLAFSLVSITARGKKVSSEQNRLKQARSLPIDEQGKTPETKEDFLMGMVVRTNTMANNAFRQLGMNNTQVSKSLEKLASGYRINRAGDDAAGLAVSESMKAQIKGLEAASSNSQDAISLVQTAEGALTEVHDMLNRMVELATKAANGTYTDEQRGNYQDEIKQLQDEIDRISQTTDFNGQKLLNGSITTTGLTMQVGATAATTNQLTVTIANMGTASLGISAVKVNAVTSAQAAISAINKAITTVSKVRSALGAMQNRLEHTINNLDTTSENLSAANSRIRDTDMAKEMMKYTQMNVLVQSAQAMLAQANQQPQSVLQLLQ